MWRVSSRQLKTIRLLPNHSKTPVIDDNMVARPPTVRNMF